VALNVLETMVLKVLVLGTACAIKMREGEMQCALRESERVSRLTRTRELSMFIAAAAGFGGWPRAVATNQRGRIWWPA
jgi:hypothetical protein